MTANSQFARRLSEVADLLEAQHANPFRVAAYRRAATSLANLTEPVADLLQREGLEGLRQIPGVGDSLAASIRSLILTGRLPYLDHLRGETDPIEILRSAPGIGRVQAERLHHDLGIDTLEELEAAAHDGRLENLAGFGGKRVAAIADSLATRLSRLRSTPPKDAVDAPIGELLDVDREYLQGASRGSLPKIAPRRFNPKHEEWLPILHTQRGPRHYTALFSNTARAHQLGRTRDWVVLYHDGPAGNCQHTVVTSHEGPLAGRRVVRGREYDCITHYAAHRAAATT